MSSQACSAAAASPINHNLIRIERDLNFSLVEKRICEVAFGLIPVLAGAIIFSGALALPYASFLFSTGLPLAILLVSRLYFKALDRVKRCEKDLAFEQLVAAHSGNREKAYMQRFSEGFQKVITEIGQSSGLLSKAATSSTEIIETPRQRLAESWDRLEFQVFPDLFDALRVRLGREKIEDLGVLYPRWRATRLELDAAGTPSPYFVSAQGRPISFQQLFQMIPQPSSGLDTLLTELQPLVSPSASSSGSFRVPA